MRVSWQAEFMIRMRRRGLVVVLFAVLAVSGYCVYTWRNAPRLHGQQHPKTTASTTVPHHATASRKKASAPTTVSPASQSLHQLHAAFRESQRCIEERV